MRVTMEVEIGEIRNCFGRAGRWHLASPHEAPETLSHFHVRQVWRMELVAVSKETGFDSGAKRGLQEKLEQGRGIDDDHADSRSSRMTTEAGVFKVTRFRLWILLSISSRVGRAARRSSSVKR